MSWVYVLKDFIIYARNFNDIENDQYKLSRLDIWLGGITVPVVNIITCLMVTFLYMRGHISDFIGEWLMIQLVSATYPGWLYCIAKFNLIPKRFLK